MSNQAWDTLSHYVALPLKLSLKAVQRAYYGKDFFDAESQQARINELQALVSDMIKYPPSAEGIPLLDEASIGHAFRSVIKETFLSSGMTMGTPDEKFPCFANTYLPVINKLIGYYHLLPASEYHHHNEVGGLISHCLEVGLMSLRLAKNRKVEPIGFQDVERRREPRWQFATWLCGVMHDCGKIISDINVVSMRAEDVIWQPQAETIYEWADKNNVERYHIVWNPHRAHRGHEKIAAIMITSMINGIVKKWLFDPTDDLSAPIVSALQNYNKRDGYIEVCVRTADHLSAERDLKTQFHKLLGKRRSGLEQSLLNAIKDCRKNKWKKVNKPNSRLFVIHDEVYLRYPEAIEDIIKTINSFQVNRVPVDPKAVLSLLESSAIVIRNHEQSNTSVLVFHDESNVQVKVNVVRLNFVGVAYDYSIVPPSLTDCQLLLSSHGETVNIAVNGDVTYTEPNRQFKTAFNYDGHIEPAIQPPIQQPSAPASNSSPAVQSSPAQGAASQTPPAGTASNTVQPGQQSAAGQKSPSTGAGKNSQPKKPAGKKNKPGNAPATDKPNRKKTAIKFANDGPDTAPNVTTMPPASNQTATDKDEEWGGMGIGVKPGAVASGSEEPAPGLTMTPPVSSGTDHQQGANKPVVQKPAQRQQSRQSKSEQQGSCKECSPAALGLVYLALRGYLDGQVSANTLLLSKDQHHLMITISAIEQLADLYPALDPVAIIDGLKGDKKQCFKLVEVPGFGEAAFRSNKNILQALCEILGVTASKAKQIFPLVSPMGKVTTQFNASQLPETLTINEKTESIILSSHLARDIGLLKEGVKR
ncbi:MobH family relaxase [uncultured Photobacterium sp.]|uniref:MobH family relaxase n=1 Tax=uncultured Photobacterium sp. TaxID=173973 RepID=UPI002602EBA6|nr:MobH family relaxase [uncultured Photobacterium sp.]